MFQLDRSFWGTKCTQLQSLVQDALIYMYSIVSTTPWANLN